VAELIRAYKEGATTYELARHYRLHRETVSKILERQAVPRRLQSMTPEELRQAISLYSSGLSLLAVGKKLGFDRTTIWRALNGASVPLRPRPGWKYTQQLSR
jgi:hypothetical protein